ncbi:MAG: type I DNA topoisomerase [Elusimicrobiota bacterium]
MEKVIVVESAAKTKTIRRFLRGKYTVIACGGHIVDLPDAELGIDIENNFKYRTESKYFRGKNKVESLRKKLSGADEIYLATDPDREGEAIAADIFENCISDSARVRRIEFNAIVYHKIKEALESPRDIDKNRVESQRARRTLDRLIGFILSSITKFDPEGPGVPAVGRVMTPAVSLVVDREKERESFQPREYWNLQALLKVSGEELKTEFEDEIENFEQVEEIVNNIRKAGSMKVSQRLENPENKQNPLPSYTTDSLQDDADNLLGFTPEKTMRLAQKLYQGIEIEGAAKALITYMRTDSTRLSPSALNLAKKTFKNRKDTDIKLYKGRTWTPSGGEQDAHEAIRPTLPHKKDYFPENLKGKLKNDYLQLYKLIYYRFLASQARPAVYYTTRLKLKVNKYKARARGDKLIKPGFLKLYKKIYENFGRKEIELPSVSEGTVLKLKRIWPEPEKTYPPPRYREGSLISELKNRGIGRPSTYGTTLQKIKRSRGGYGYVRKVGGKLKPTSRGKDLCEYMHSNFSNVISYDYTAKMEDRLTKIEEGKLSYEKFLKKEFNWLEEPYKIASKKGWMDNKHPTPAQIDYLKNLVKETGHQVPEEVYNSKEEVSDWIGKLKKEVPDILKFSKIKKVDVSGVECYRFKLYFNFKLPDEEIKFLKNNKLKYKPGRKGTMPSYQFQRRDKEKVKKLKQKLYRRYSENKSTIKIDYDLF